MVYWIPWPQKHRNRHQDHRNRMSFSRFIVKNVFWWRPSLISNFRREALECRRVSHDFWNLHTQNPPRAKFHASFRKCTPNSHIRPTIATFTHTVGTNIGLPRTVWYNVGIVKFQSNYKKFIYNFFFPFLQMCVISLIGNVFLMH